MAAVSVSPTKKPSPVLWVVAVAVVAGIVAVQHLQPRTTKTTTTTMTPGEMMSLSASSTLSTPVTTPGVSVGRSPTPTAFISKSISSAAAVAAAAKQEHQEDDEDAEEVRPLKARAGVGHVDDDDLGGGGIALNFGRGGEDDDVAASTTAMMASARTTKKWRAADPDPSGPDMVIADDEDGHLRSTHAICLRLRVDEVVAARNSSANRHSEDGAAFEEALLLRGVETRLLHCSSPAVAAAGGACNHRRGRRQRRWSSLTAFIGVHFLSDIDVAASGMGRVLEVIRRCKNVGGGPIQVVVLSDEDWLSENHRQQAQQGPSGDATATSASDRCSPGRRRETVGVDGQQQQQQEKSPSSSEPQHDESMPMIAMWLAWVAGRHTYHSLYGPTGALQMVITAHVAERAIFRSVRDVGDDGASAWWNSSGLRPLTNGRSRGGRGGTPLQFPEGASLAESTVHGIPFLPLITAERIRTRIVRSGFATFVLGTLFNGVVPRPFVEWNGESYADFGGGAMAEMMCGSGARWTVIGLLGSSAVSSDWTSNIAPQPVTNPLQPPVEYALKNLQRLLLAKLEADLSALLADENGKKSVEAVSSDVLYIPRTSNTFVWCALKRIRGVSKSMRKKILRLLIARQNNTMAQEDEPGPLVFKRLKFEKLPVVLQYAAVKRARYVLAPDGAPLVWILFAGITNTTFVDVYRHFHLHTDFYAVNYFITIAKSVQAPLVIVEEKNFIGASMGNVELALSQVEATINSSKMGTAQGQGGDPVAADVERGLEFRTFGNGYSLARSTVQYVPARRRTRRTESVQRQQLFARWCPQGEKGFSDSRQ